MLSLGTKIAIALFIVSLLLIAIGLFWKWRVGGDRYSEGNFFGPVIMIVGFVMGTATLLFSYPYSLEYHTLEHHSGTVSKVERRIVTDGSESANITREVAFWFEGEELAYGTTDIRLNGVKPGDVVELRRQLNWNYGGVDHWDVKFLDLTPAAN